MVIDELKNFEKYIALHPLFPKFWEFCKTHSLKELAEGKIELQGNDLVVNVQFPTAKTRETARLETHNLFIDIQIPLTDNEEMGYTPASACTPHDAPYNAEKDITFFEGTAHDYFVVRPGMFTIFFPQDGHAPGITAAGAKKIVVKVRA
ncbi:MAG: YhcH/YjgK/YiaL family protein [Mediterranea sp.]|jgi:YhcH/YjgK/YiaL family protein|nr:YhcH/YjgK/YiaL family protein [Mediterranea sp.]